MQWFTPVIPALWKAEVDRSLESRSLKPAWATWRDPVSTKKILISQVWWYTPIVSAIQEAEVGGSLEPRGRAAVSCICTTVLQFGQQSKMLSEREESQRKKET